MTVFDQRGQRVQYQFNAAGDINISAVQSKDELTRELEKLKVEVERAKDSNAIDADLAVEAEYHLLQATKEARKEKPQTSFFLEHINSAKGLLDNVAAVAGIATSLAKVAEIASAIFN